MYGKEKFVKDAERLPNIRGINNRIKGMVRQTVFEDDCFFLFGVKNGLKLILRFNY